MSFADCVDCGVKSRMAQRFAYPEGYRPNIRHRSRREDAVEQDHTAIYEKNGRACSGELNWDF